MSVPKRYTDAQKREMVRRYIGGETLKAIANDIGCSIATVSDYVNKHFRGELVLEDNTERNDTMDIEEKNIETKETTAAVGAATVVKENLALTERPKSPYTYDNTEAAFCQALLTQILELADDIVIALGQADSVEAAQHAGMIKGLAVALGKVWKAQS